MSLGRIIWRSLLLTVLLWFFFAWPLPSYLTRGIPCTSARTEANPARRMIQGDHLQLLYNYWLFADMAAGKTPVFHNLYEFNLGDDAARREVGNYNFPFAAVFTLFYRLGGRALGWNINAFVSLWLTYLFTWLWLRRYVRSDRLAGTAALLAISLPFTWVMLLGGSPAGPAMAWVPLLLLGADMAVRDGRVAGGAAAALALLFAWWGDTHVFLFSVLLAPLSVLLPLVARDRRWTPRALGRAAFALLPFGAALVTLAGVAALQKAAVAAVMPAGQGRSVREVLFFSAYPAGLLAWHAPGVSGHIHVGVALLILLGAGGLACLWLGLRRRRGQGRELLLYSLLLISAAGVITLACGPHGPRGGIVFHWMRAHLPGYSLIRQPAKAFCILPPLLALLGALALHALAQLRSPPRKPVYLFTFVVLGLILLEQGLQVRPGICLLDEHQSAYGAVAADAREAGRVPRALITPLWPGDSSWASIYEHYVSLYRIRMVNGYRPIVPAGYLRDAFDAFGSVNLGQLDDDQLDRLLQRGIDYILLHEDAFPEKVSPFPVAFTLKRLLNHPRLRFLHQGESVWAFRILEAPTHKTDLLPGWNLFFPVIWHDMARCRQTNTIVVTDASAGAGRCLRLPADASATARTWQHWNAPNSTFLLRARGTGRAEVRILFDEGIALTQELVLNEADWHWLALRFIPSDGSTTATPEFIGQEGALDFDQLAFVSGNPPAPEPGETIDLPAPLFFHAGCTLLREDAVRLRPSRDPALGIFYGPRLPLPAGTYRITVHGEVQADPGTEAGVWYVEGEQFRSAEQPLRAGEDGEGIVTLTSNRPVQFVFVFNRAAPVKLAGISLTRLR